MNKKILSKVCSKCLLEKPLDKFRKAKHYKHGVTRICIECFKIIKKEYRNKNKKIIKIKDQEYRKRKSVERYVYNKQYRIDKKDKHRNWFLKWKFGITLEQYNTMLSNQSFSCAICKIKNIEVKKAFAVDHCHKTNKIRGLLCDSCNKGLGLFRDNVNSLSNAMNYLQKVENA